MFIIHFYGLTNYFDGCQLDCLTDMSSMTGKEKFDEYLHLCNICKLKTLTSRHMFPGYQAVLVFGHVAQQEAYDTEHSGMNMIQLTGVRRLS